MLYSACLIDWDRETERMTRFAERFDAGEQVRIVGAGTDLTLSLAGREGNVDDGHDNMPGGEFFYSPARGLGGRRDRVLGVPLELPGARVRGHPPRLPRTARSSRPRRRRARAMLHALIDRDEGARRIGELGIGCNPASRAAMKHVLFDEKIDGSVHLALGQSYEKVGGKNTSSIHWDIVKDLRAGGRIELDGEPRARERRLADLRSDSHVCGASRGRGGAAARTAALRAHGLEPVWEVWDDPAVDWSRFELVVVRSAWDYAERWRSSWRWAEGRAADREPAPRPPLRCGQGAVPTALAAAGVPVVPTTFVHPGEPFAPPEEPFVVKPAISAGGRRSARFGPTARPPGTRRRDRGSRRDRDGPAAALGRRRDAPSSTSTAPTRTR